MVISIQWCIVIALTIFGLSILAGQGGAVDSERVLPMVLNHILPIGVKELVLAGFIAAFMSTFDTGLNVTASVIVNDMVKPFWKNATNKTLIYVSYGATLGILVSFHTENIKDIWITINFALGSMFFVPVLLAPYWRRRLEIV